MENWLLKRVKTSPNKRALISDNVDFTFNELNRTVQKFASKLYYNGVRKGDYIGVFIANSFNGYIAILALQQVGAKIVFLNTRLSEPELNYQIEDSKIKFCLIDNFLRVEDTDKIKSCPAIPLSDILFSDISPDYSPVEEFEDDEVTSIMYTSGTTGKPKGVLQTYQNHFYSTIGTDINMDINCVDLWLLTVPIFHISGFSIIMRSLILGFSVYLVDKFREDKVNRILIENPITIVSLVPTMLKRLLNNLEPKQSFNDNFRFIFLGGGPIDELTLLRCESLKIPVLQSFGMTETSSNIVALNNEDARRKIGSSGKPLFPVQLKIEDPNNEGVGEILVKAKNVSPGYLNKEEKYKSKITSDGYFKTGDLGYIDRENFLYIKGRLDDMFVSGGENIYPNEIEDVYQGLDYIKEIAITSIPNSDWGEVPVAYMVVKLGADLNREDLIEFGKKHLAHYKVPVDFRVIRQMPKTASGKIQKFALKNIDYQSI